MLLEQSSINADNLGDFFLSDFPRKAVHKISPDIEDERGIPVVREGGLAPSSLLSESILLDSLRDNEIANNVAFTFLLNTEKWLNQFWVLIYNESVFEGRPHVRQH